MWDHYNGCVLKGKKYNELKNKCVKETVYKLTSKCSTLNLTIGCHVITANKTTTRLANSYTFFNL